MPRRFQRRRRRTYGRRRPMVVMPRVREEMKTIDINVGDPSASPFPIINNPANATESTIFLSQIPRGSSSVTRIGRRTLVKAIQLRGYIIPMGTGAVFDKVTLCLIYDRMPNNPSAMPLTSDVFESGVSRANCLSKRDNAQKFKILRRWDFAMNTSTSSDNSRVIEEYITFRKPLVCQWTTGDDTGVFTNVEKGAIYLMVMASEAKLVDANKFGLRVNARLYFNESDGYMY